MNHISVKSSNVISIAYDPVKSIMKVKYNSGMYQYHGVPEHVYKQVMGSSSVGSSLHKLVKGNFKHTIV